MVYVVVGSVGNVCVVRLDGSKDEVVDVQLQKRDVEKRTGRAMVLLAIETESQVVYRKGTDVNRKVKGIIGFRSLQGNRRRTALQRSEVGNVKRTKERRGEKHSGTAPEK